MKITAGRCEGATVRGCDGASGLAIALSRLAIAPSHPRTIAQPIVMIVVVLVSLLIVPAGAQAQGARLQLDHLDRLAGQAAETVNISIDPAMLKLATAFLKDDQNAELKQMMSEIRGIYVRSFEFERDDAYTPDDVSAVRKQLAAPGWSRLVTVDSKRDRELVEIYSWREGNEAGGLAILVSEPRELTVVNIVGPIDLTRLGALQGQFGIPRLPSVPRPSAPPPPPPAGR